MKSECSECQKKIAALALGDLDDRERLPLEAHLEVCPHCRSEQEAYGRTAQRLTATADEDVPHHFFVYPEPQSMNLWQLFRSMPLPWQAAAAGLAMIVLLVSVSAISRLQVRSDASGWAISFGGNSVDTEALSKNILQAAARRQQETTLALIRDMKREIERSNTNLTLQQQARLTNALEHLDSRLSGRISSAEGQVREDTRILVSELYRTIARQRAQELELINLRIDSTEVNSAIRARQMDEILGTLLQVADASLSQ